MASKLFLIKAAKPVGLALAGAVSYQGYKYWGEAQEKLRISGDRQKMSALFDKIDKDKSGMINGGELKVALKDAGVDVNFVNLKAMMMYADKDGNGEISKDEWLDMVDKLTSDEAMAVDHYTQSLELQKENDEAKRKKEKLGKMLERGGAGK